jgi:VanZ family protein
MERDGHELLQTSGGREQRQAENIGQPENDVRIATWLQFFLSWVQSPNVSSFLLTINVITLLIRGIVLSIILSQNGISVAGRGLPVADVVFDFLGFAFSIYGLVLTCLSIPPNFMVVTGIFVVETFSFAVVTMVYSHPTNNKTFFVDISWICIVFDLLVVATTAIRIFVPYQYDAFFSHSWGPHPHVDHQKCKRLKLLFEGKPHRLSIWLDENMLRNGAHMKKTLMGAVLRSDVFVAFVTKVYIGKLRARMIDDYCVCEYEYAICSRVPIIPIKLEVLNDEENEVYKQFFRDIMYCDISGHIGELDNEVRPNLDRLLQTVADAINAKKRLDVDVR